MSSCREVITLQFGHYANYVGAHFWNIQELSFDYTGKKKTDVNHDVLYREGSGEKTTYTPRLLLADLNGALGSLSTHGGLLEQNAHTELESLTNGLQIEKKEEATIEKNDYLKYINNEIDEIEDFNFETNVKTWTDFLFPRFHQRTISVIHEYKHNDDKVQFDIFPSGTRLWKSSAFSEDFEEKIRKYAEECDNFQGFQIFLDATDGFGGLANGCIEYLTEDYHNKCIYAIPLIPSYFSDNKPQNEEELQISNKKDSTRVINMALTFMNLFENSSMFVPICCGQNGWRKPGKKREFYNVNYNSELYYHSSSIIASALDTLSLGYRFKSDSFALSDLCTDLTGYGRKMAAASLGLPFYMQQKHDLIEHLDRVEFPLWSCITPSCEIAKEKIFQHVTVRGIPEEKLKKPLKHADEQIKMNAYNCESVKEMFELYFQCNYYASVTHVTTSSHGLEVKMPYPKLFSKNLNSSGFVKEFVDDDPDDIETLPVIAGVHNGNFIFDTFDSLFKEIKRVKIGKLHKFGEEGLEQDDFSESMERLRDFQDNYKDSFDL